MASRSQSDGCRGVAGRWPRGWPCRWAWGGRVGRAPGFVVDGLVGGEPSDGLVGVVEAVGVDALADRRGVVLGEPVEGDVGALVGPRQVDAREVGVDAPEDGDRALVVADVELLLAPGVRRGTDDPDHAQDRERGEQPTGEQEAARRPRGVPHLLGVDRVALDRERHVVRDLGADRLELAGVAGPVAAEQVRHRRQVRPPLEVGGRADQHRLLLAGQLVLVDDVGHHAGDVVGRAGLEAGPHELDRGVVGRAHRQHVGQPAVVEHPAGAVAAEQQPVAALELEVEQVGVDVVHAVDRLEDQVAVRVGARLLAR